MISHIQGPEDSCSTQILLKDILYLKTSTLCCLDRAMHSLYVFVKHDEEEFFHLFVYDDTCKLQVAHDQLSGCLKADAADDQFVWISPDIPKEAVV